MKRPDWRLVALVAFVLLAFAGNSVLTRAALAEARIGPAAFAAIRLAAGAAMLAAIVAVRGGGIRPRLADAPGAVALFVYAAAFSFAYVELSTATGALILFGVVQCGMLGLAAAGGRAPAAREALGLAVALAGFIWLLAPGVVAPPLGAAGLMAAAGLAWAVYTLLGRGAGEPVARTARSFLGAVPLGLLVLLVVPEAPADAVGVGLAVVSGAIASAVGYAVWYAVLPRLSVTVAGLAQLLVPAIATAAGVWWLGEAVSARLLGATALILAGIGLGIAGRRRQGDRASS